MNAIATTKPRVGELITADQANAIRTALKTSLYPGATDASVDMVLSYCRASGLDPMTKPVHIVPMSVKVGKDDRGYDIKETRDVVMPGIGLYRINAARTEAYAGCSEPEFGPTRTMPITKDIWSDGPNGKRTKKTVDGGTFEYPEWCRITVTRIVDGVAREFSAKEYWIENYATAGNDSETPNAMWRKRPYGQLAKCTEAQALRKAFPEAVGSQPTAEEMEGKDVIEGHATVVQHPAATLEAPVPAEYPETDFKKNLATWGEVITSGRKSAAQIIAMVSAKGVLSEDQKNRIFDFEPPAPVSPAEPVEAEVQA